MDKLEKWILAWGEVENYCFEVLLCVRSYLIVIARFFIIKMNLLFSFITFKYSTILKKT